MAEFTRPLLMAKAIRPLSDRGVEGPASFVARVFDLDAVAGTETLLISALGLYRAFINGKRVGADLLTPGWTSYDKRLPYQSYQVADFLKPGVNRIEIWLADGWLRSRMMWGGLNVWGGHIGAIAELRAAPGDAAPILITDKDWKSGELPVRKSGIYFGEVYDATFAHHETHGVEQLNFDHSILVPQEAPPVRELSALKPIRSWQDGHDTTVYDFGQNIGGYVRATLRGPAGSKVTISHAEVLDKDGNFYNGNYRGAEAVFELTLNDGGDQTYSPLFTFYGFRYARLTIESGAEVVDIASVPISSVPVATAGFTSANGDLNKLFLNTIWSQRANFIDVPTDCPQRDERLGWTGDAQVFAGTACYLADCHAFLRKWVRDLMADQREDGAIPHVCPDPTRLKPQAGKILAGSTGWGDAIYMVPWQLYLHYGDTAVLREALPAMIKWVDFVWSISGGPIVRPPRRLGERGFTFGDWLQPSGPSSKPFATIGDDAAATLYLYIAASRVCQIASIVGDIAASDRLRKMAGEVKAAFSEEFISPSGRIGSDDQTSYALALLHDIIPEEKIPAARQHFLRAIDRTDGRIGTGFIGTPALLPALAKIGDVATAAAMLLQEGVPGWLYQVKMGATSIWERWDAIQPDGALYNPQMNSYNHYAYGAVCEFLLESVAGFRPDPKAPGFANVVIEPRIIPQLSPVEAFHDSPRGRVAASWSLTSDTVTYKFEIPRGSTGELILAPTYGDVLLDGEPTSGSRINNIGDGHHILKFTITNTPIVDFKRDGDELP